MQSRKERAATRRGAGRFCWRSLCSLTPQGRTPSGAGSTVSESDGQPSRLVVRPRALDVWGCVRPVRERVTRTSDK